MDRPGTVDQTGAEVEAVIDQHGHLERVPAGDAVEFLQIALTANLSTRHELYLEVPGKPGDQQPRCGSFNGRPVVIGITAGMGSPSSLALLAQ